MKELGPELEKAETVKRLKSLRDDFSDDIPDEILHSNDEDNKYKVRGSWFQGVIADTEGLLSYASKDAPELEEIKEIMNYFTDSEEFRGKMSSRTERSDIDKGNRLIELALKVVGEG